MVVVESAGMTDVGRKRKGNEDALFVDDRMRLYVVADGMGGHQAGEVASGLVVRTIHDCLKRFNENGGAEELADPDDTLSREANQLLSSIRAANLEVNRLALTRPSWRGMGSTVSTCYFTDESFIAANVGDSPIWLVHEGKIETLSVPHTVMAEQAMRNPGRIDYPNSRFSHMLTRAMGVDATVRVDMCEVQCFKDDILVIGSDGLSNKVSPEEILSVVSDVTPAAACRVLVDLANARGGDDNISVIVVRVKAIVRKKRGREKWIAGLLEKFMHLPLCK